MNVLTPDVVKKLEKSGKIAAEALAYGAKLIRPGAKLLDVAEKTESFIVKQGGECAFPVNISLNQTAAHYTPTPDDKTVFKDEVVKLDVGCHIDGWVGGDTAVTIDLSKANAELVKASRDALNNALKIVQIGTTLGEIGKTVQETIESFGLKPVKNLSGHEMSNFKLHTGLSIPNYASGEKTELKKGMIIAIEPFATNGVGLIQEKGVPFIYSIVNKKPVRSQTTREVLKLLQPYQNLPFATRWLTKKIPIFKVRFALKEMDGLGMLRSYAPLVEREDGLVSQAEHTVLVDDKVKVLTKI